MDFNDDIVFNNEEEIDNDIQNLLLQNSIII